MRISSSQALVSLLLLALFPLAACVDEKVIFEEPDDQPGEIPAAGGGFVGYSGHDAKLTYCGTCHAGTQAEWLKTAHSKAWAGLQESGHAAASCEGCHSTNELGNAATKASGYLATKDPRYEDVQCEACHGAGLQHIAAPSKANLPKAPLGAGTLLNTGCGECHRSTMTPQLEEWAASRHSRLSGLSSGSACTACHSGDGALKAWGVDTDFAEKQPTTTGAVAVTCAVCHDPHGSANDAGLRFPINTASLATNLCMRCHQERPGLDFSGMPHAGQGTVLLGDAGWRPASLQGRIPVTHGIVASNPGLCVTCHGKTRELKDAAGAVTFRDTGHRFWATPCVDASGRPTSASDCADSQRDYRSCTGAGCHGTQDVARAAAARAEARTAELLASLATMLAKVPAGEFNTSDGKTSAGEGARYNRELALMDGATLHNPFLIEKLLLASINELTRVYGIRPAGDVSLAPVFGAAGSEAGVLDRIVGALASLPERLAIWAGNLSAPALGAIGVVIVAGVGAGGYYAYRTYDYVQHDNEFCMSCHLMQQPYDLFAKSAHQGLGCKACHQPTLIARSEMALTQIIENPQKINAHAEVPNERCAHCHIDGDPKKWQLIANSAGHKVHLESKDPSLEGLQCVQCHSVSLHEFSSVDKTCGQAGCHEDKKILLAGMSRLTIHCAACHNFLAPVNAASRGGSVFADSVDRAILPGQDECFSCHAMRALVKMPSPDPHQGVCAACHNPHTQRSPAEAVQSCTNAGCHVEAAGLSPMHKGLEPGVLEDCTWCHKAHDFKVDGNRCTDCHKGLDQNSPSVRPRVHPDTAAAPRAERVGSVQHLPATLPLGVRNPMPNPRRAGRESNP